METITRKSLLYKTNVEYADYCLNHVLGCSHGCLYPCYAYLLKKRTGAVKDYKEWTEPKIVSNTPCVILTKGLYPIPDGWGSIYDLFGITLVSMSEDFREKYEPGASNLKDRVVYLKQLHSLGFKTWVSMEPYPTPNIIEQDIEEILEAIKFVDKIVFGRMNYNSLTAGYDEFYKEQAEKVAKFCLKHNIECYIKKGTVE
jgi:DNA repair photolyase